MAPNIQLPASITEGNNPDEPTNQARTPNQTSKKRKKETTYDSRKRETDLNNTKEPEQWTHPQGCRYGNFFNPAENPENTKNWPILQHHSDDRKTAMCMRLQCDGKCTNGCYFAHVNPDAVPREAQATVTAFF
jgi:hypothetical protein